MYCLSPFMSDPNPYEPPQTPSPRPNAGQKTAMLVLGLAAIPAGIVAFFITCATAGTFLENSAAVYTGAMGGLAVTVVMLFYAFNPRPKREKK
jgi:uncharacterized membrane-anchored protein